MTHRRRETQCAWGVRGLRVQSRNAVTNTPGPGVFSEVTGVYRTWVFHAHFFVQT
jgi:hypothetical protein